MAGITTGSHQSVTVSCSPRSAWWQSRFCASCCKAGVQHCSSAAWRVRSRTALAHAGTSVIANENYSTRKPPESSTSSPGAKKWWAIRDSHRRNRTPKDPRAPVPPSLYGRPLFNVYSNLRVGSVSNDVGRRAEAAATWRDPGLGLPRGDVVARTRRPGGGSDESGLSSWARRCAMATRSGTGWSGRMPGPSP